MAQVQSSNRRSSLRAQLVGTWQLVDYSTFALSNPSNKSHPLGENPTGILIYTNAGYMSAHIQVPGQQPFTSGDLVGGTTEERAEAARRYVAYCGPFDIDESSGRDNGKPVVQHHVLTSLLPNWIGDTQRRVLELETKDDGVVYLTLRPDQEVVIAGQLMSVQLVWRRLPDTAA